jgi:hypothetical protein
MANWRPPQGCWDYGHSGSASLCQRSLGRFPRFRPRSVVADGELKVIKDLDQKSIECLGNIALAVVDGTPMLTRGLWPVTILIRPRISGVFVDQIYRTRQLVSSGATACENRRPPRIGFLS